MSDLGPLIMSPVLAEKPWGGRRLGEFGKSLPENTWIGESWEVADLPEAGVTTVPDPRSRVASGPHAGRTLRELIAEYGTEFLGSAAPTHEGDFPLLVKLLDAREHLSVQVHPDAKYVADHPEARLKTESWYVVAAAPDAHLYLGLRPGVAVSDVAARIGTAGVVGLLDVVPARAGDFHHLPAGLVHARGAGVVVAEVQTPSNTTFRIYDWEDRYDRPRRQMHGAEALEAIRPELRSHFLRRPDEPGVHELIVNAEYWIREHRSSGAAVDICRAAEVRVIIVLSGNATVDGIDIEAGATLVLPASLVAATHIEAATEAILLEVGLVHPTSSPIEM